MRDPKVYRLVLGIVILFSIFIFQGSNDHGGCTQCENPSLGGSLTVINNSDHNINVFILPSAVITAMLSPGGSKVLYLDKGVYGVLAHQLAGFDMVKLLAFRMVEIKLGSNKTVEIK